MPRSPIASGRPPTVGHDHRRSGQRRLSDHPALRGGAVGQGDDVGEREQTRHLIARHIAGQQADVPVEPQAESLGLGPVALDRLEEGARHDERRTGPVPHALAWRRSGRRVPCTCGRCRRTGPRAGPPTRAARATSNPSRRPAACPACSAGGAGRRTGVPGTSCRRRSADGRGEREQHVPLAEGRARQRMAEREALMRTVVVTHDHDAAPRHGAPARRGSARTRRTAGSTTAAPRGRGRTARAPRRPPSRSTAATGRSSGMPSSPDPPGVGSGPCRPGRVKLG